MKARVRMREVKHNAMGVSTKVIQNNFMIEKIKPKILMTISNNFVMIIRAFKIKNHKNLTKFRINW